MTTTIATKAEYIRNLAETQAADPTLTIDSPCTIAPAGWSRKANGSVRLRTSGSTLNAARLLLSFTHPEVLNAGMVADHIQSTCPADCLTLSHLQPLTHAENARKGRRDPRPSHLIVTSEASRKASRASQREIARRYKNRSVDEVFAALFTLFPEGMIPCQGACGETLHYSSFHKDSERLIGRVQVCKDCKSRQRTEKYTRTTQQVVEAETIAA